MGTARPRDGHARPQWTVPERGSGPLWTVRGGRPLGVSHFGVSRLKRGLTCDNAERDVGHMGKIGQRAGRAFPQVRASEPSGRPAFPQVNPSPRHQQPGATVCGVGPPGPAQRPPGRRAAPRGRSPEHQVPHGGALVPCELHSDSRSGRPRAADKRGHRVRRPVAMSRVRLAVSMRTSIPPGRARVGR